MQNGTGKVKTAERATETTTVTPRRTVRSRIDPVLKEKSLTKKKEERKGIRKDLDPIVTVGSAVGFPMTVAARSPHHQIPWVPIQPENPQGDAEEGLHQGHHLDPDGLDPGTREKADPAPVIVVIITGTEGEAGRVPSIEAKPGELSRLDEHPVVKEDQHCLQQFPRHHLPLSQHLESEMPSPVSS